MRCDSSKFLTEVHKLFESNAASGSVYITMKRTTERSKSALKKATEPVSESECKCLVRATDGKRKFSTTLTQRELASFHDSYMTILKAHTHNLKRRRAPKKA
ncbi:hypothetical protein H632_c3999p0 [Helicosporidium sp. ATCC 50920]|nr:hypothetical protein H632_c3999p0 [Helicosporidium sp. ATCC 50920]|eukprot:KDD72015.1 hypothetical protein H632_c3999p0 [Helicosporidium sp. ATCC 50920]